MSGYKPSRFPQIATLEKLNIDRDTAKQIRKILESKSVKKALELVDPLIEGSGVEYIAHKNDTQWDRYGLEYINLGDTYVTTLIFNWRTKNYAVTSYGDIVERSMNEYP